MTVKERQKEIEREYAAWERMQTQFSFDEELYRYCEAKIHSLDLEADELRRMEESDGVHEQ